jgi:hypothetical protein
MLRLQCLDGLVFGGLRRLRWQDPAISKGQDLRRGFKTVILLTIGRIEYHLVVAPELLEIVASDWR